MVSAIWHFSFTVSDLQQSIEFYCDGLGFELIHTQEQSNEYTRRLVGYADAHLKVAMLAVPGPRPGISSHDLELVQYLRPRGTRGDINIYNHGAAHLAVVVRNIQLEYDRLLSRGVRFVSPPNAIVAGVNEGGYTCYFRDPDDIVLELMQPPARRFSAG